LGKDFKIDAAVSVLLKFILLSSYYKLVKVKSQTVAERR
jgi:hypothetical protein